MHLSLRIFEGWAKTPGSKLLYRKTLTCSVVSVPQRCSSGMNTAAPPSARPPDLATASVIASVTGFTAAASSSWQPGQEVLSEG